MNAWPSNFYHILDYQNKQDFISRYCQDDRMKFPLKILKLITNISIKFYDTSSKSVFILIFNHITKQNLICKHLSPKGYHKGPALFSEFMTDIQ